MLSWFRSKFSQKGRLFFVLFSAGLLSGIYLLCNQVTCRAAGREGTRGLAAKDGSQRAGDRSALFWEQAVGSDKP